MHRERRLSKAALRRIFAEHEPVQVWMEACGTAHHWGRELQRLGHQVSLLPPAVVRPYRTGNKTDRADTKALLEAARNNKIPPVPVKSVEQQAVTARHGLRSAHLATRTARISCSVWCDDRPFESRRTGAWERRRLSPTTDELLRDDRTTGHRSDRRGVEPMTSLAIRRPAVDRIPARGFP